MALQKLNYKLTVYFDTGFGGENIPMSAAVLNSGTIRKKVYNDVYYLREDLTNPSITVNDNYHELADVDYVCLTAYSSGQGMRADQPVNMYYFASPYAVTGGATGLELELDALLTMGGVKNLEFITGWQTRGHLSQAEDGLFDNVASEDFAPVKPLVVTHEKKISIEREAGSEIPDTGDFNFITSTINLSLDDDSDSIKILRGVDSNDEEKMYLPLIEVNETATSFLMKIPDANTLGNELTYSFHIPSVALFDADKTLVKKNIQKLFSAGQLQLQNSYAIPKKYIRAIFYRDEESTALSQLDCERNLRQEDEFPFIFVTPDYTIKNKKCYNMFRNFTCYSPATGSMLAKIPSELRFRNNTAVTIMLWADLAQTGRPYFKFVSDEMARSPFNNFIGGAQWYSSQLILEGAYGSMIMQKNHELELSNLTQSYRGLEAGKLIADNDLNLSGSELTLRQGANMANGLIEQASVLGGLYGMTNSYLSGATGRNKTSLGDINNGVGNAMSGIVNRVTQIGLQMLEADRLTDERLRLDTNYKTSRQKLSNAVKQANLNYTMNHDIVLPTNMFTPDPSLALYGENDFYLYETRMQDSDIIELDRYFNRFGYRGLHRPLTSECFDKRQYFTYVEASDVTLKSKLYSIGLDIRNKAILQLNGGVRVWKVKPDPTLIDNNV